MKVIAAILCLAATVNAAAVLPLESSLVKSDRVGDNFSYSIHQNHGYAVSPDVKEVVQPVVPSVEVKQHHVVPYHAAVVPYAEQSVVPFEFKSHVVPASTAYYAQQPVVSVAAPVEVKEHHVLPASTAYYAQQPVVSVPIKTHVVSPVEVKATDYKPVVNVVPSYYSSYVQPYVSSMYPYASYASLTYPYVKTDKYVS